MGSQRGKEWRRPDLGGSRLREHRLPQEGGVERDGGNDGVDQRQEQDTEEAQDGRSVADASHGSREERICWRGKGRRVLWSFYTFSVF
jgi:hypothetical protein